MAIVVTTIRVVIRFGLTVNLGDFNSVKEEIEVEAAVPQGQNCEAVIDYLQQLAEGHVQRVIKKVKAGAKTKTNHVPDPAWEETSR